MIQHEDCAAGQTVWPPYVVVIAPEVPSNAKEMYEVGRTPKLAVLAATANGIQVITQS